MRSTTTSSKRRPHAGNVHQLLLDPVYTDRGAGTLALKCSRPDEPEGEEQEKETPEFVVTKTELLAPYPNPFNPSATVSFTLLDPGQVSLVIYDLRGRLVKKLLNEHRGQGLHEVVWHGRDELGLRVSSGVYFVRLQAKSVDEIERMLMVK